MKHKSYPHNCSIHSKGLASCSRKCSYNLIMHKSIFVLKSIVIMKMWLVVLSDSFCQKRSYCFIPITDFLASQYYFCKERIQITENAVL